MAEKTPKYAELDYTFQDRFEGKEVSFSFRFAKPDRPRVDRAQKAMIKKQVDQAMRQLCLDTIHEDDRQAFLDALAEYPGLPGTFGEAILDSCGFGQLGN